MTNSIISLSTTAASADNLAIDHLIERARAYAEAAVPPNTLRAYAASWRSFTDFCAGRGIAALPAAPQTVALYVTQRSEQCAISTIRLNLAAIASKHAENGLESPCTHEVVRRILRGMARTKGTATRRKDAITIDPLRAMLLEIRGDGLKATRDRALLLLGFAAALRRSELAAIDVSHVAFCKEGLRLTIPRSKTDQAGESVEIAVPHVPNRSLCAVRALKAWLEASGIVVGPIFRSFSLQREMLDHAVDGRAVANLIQSLARKAHLAGDFSGHSLRAGFVTAAAQAKCSLDAIARTTRHKSLSVLMSYVRPAQAFDDVALTSMIA